MNAFVAAGVMCRNATGVCDVAERCDGINANCPANVFAPTTLVCRARATQCDEEERCAGNSADCPADVFKKSGSLCDDSDMCTKPDT